MNPSPTPEERARAWLLERLDEMGTDPERLASMPQEEVLARLREGDADADAEAALGRIVSGARRGTLAAEHATGVNQPPPRPPAQPPRERRRTRSPWLSLASVSEIGFIAVALLLAVLVYLGVAIAAALQPEHRDLIVLEDYEGEVQRSLQRSSAAVEAGGEGVWAVAGPPLTDFMSGWRILRSASRGIFGITYGYEKGAALEGVADLERAYVRTEETRPTSPEDEDTTGGNAAVDDLADGAFLPLGQIAFVIAQGYLMLDELEEASRWMRAAERHGDEPWASAAGRLEAELASHR